MITIKKIVAGALAASIVISGVPMAPALAANDEIVIDDSSAGDQTTATNTKEGSDPANATDPADAATPGEGEPEVPANDISLMKAGRIPDFGWSGKAIKPVDEVTFKDGTKSLKRNTDFRITGYQNNVNPGKNTAKVLIRGMGDYTGTTVLTFTITKDLIGTESRVTTENTKNGVQITWTEAKNAKQYAIYRLKSGKWKHLTTVSATKKRTYLDKLLKKNDGKLYKFKLEMIPKQTAKKKVVTFQCYRLKHPILQKPIVSRLFGHRPSVYWVSNKHSDGYQLQFKTGSTIKKRKIKGGKKAGCKMPKKWSEKTKVRIRCYKKVNGVVYYSAWGKWKNVKVY